jgi:colanic acid biosynthesis glycosyl transferase WcaI
VKIVLVNQHYPPDAGATGKLAAQLARRLARRGHQVTVITGRSTYDEAKGARAPHDEIRDGVRVVRLPLLPRRDGPAGRMLHYLSFALALLLRGPFVPRPDVLLAFSSTPLFGGAACALLARALGCPLAYVVQDVYPEVAVALGVLRPGPGERIARFLESCAWRAAARVVVIGPELAEVARSRGIDDSRLAVIANWVDPVEIGPADAGAFRREAGIGDDEFVVQYAGNLGRSQDLEAVLEAARIVEEATGAGGPSSPRVRFLFVGGGACADELRRAAEGAARVTFLPRQPEERLPEVLAAADLSLVPLRRGLTRWCVPSKVYSILASGRPVGASLDADSEVARIVEGSDCGFRVEPGDAKALAAEILRLAGDRRRAGDQGRRGRLRAETRDSVDRAVSDYEELLGDIVRSRTLS